MGSLERRGSPEGKMKTLITQQYKSYHTCIALKGTMEEIMVALAYLLKANGPKAQVRYL